MTASRVAALVTRLKTITSLGNNVVGGVPNAIAPPAAWVRPISQEALTMDLGTKNHRFEIKVGVKESELISAQEAIYAYTDSSGASSVEAAILGDESLQVMNVTMREIETQIVGNGEYVTAAWEVEML